MNIDTMNGWFHSVKKRTARISTKITASLGLITLTRDEEFERQHESFKQIEKTIKAFIKNLASFVDHVESFLLALQNTSENLAEFYRDKSHHQKELAELRLKNKALACEHFHAFKRAIDRQVIAVASQLLQKFAGPHQLIKKRSAKLLDYALKSKEMESCRDLEKKASLRDGYVIAKDLYERINKQLIDELPLFNQYALDIFRECILILIDSRKNLILSYTKQTASLLGTPLMLTYTASDVASTILMSANYELGPEKIGPEVRPIGLLPGINDQQGLGGSQTSGHGTRQSSANGDEVNSRPQSSASHISSDFDRMAGEVREISSTPLSRSLNGSHDISDQQIVNGLGCDEPDGKTSPLEDVDSKSGGIQEEAGTEDDRKSPEMVDDHRDGQTTPVKDIGERERDRNKKKKFPIYVASWSFASLGPNQLTITANQELKLIKDRDECGNPDWSLVQDKKGRFGYVPTTYIRKKD